MSDEKNLRETLAGLAKMVKAMPTIPDAHGDKCVAQGAVLAQIAALTSGDGSESAGLRERLLAKCDELDSRAKAFEGNNQYYFRGVGEGFATAAKEFRALAALAPAISRPPTQGSSLPPSRADLGGDRVRKLVEDYAEIIADIRNQVENKDRVDWVDCKNLLRLIDALAEGQQSSELVEKTPSASPGEREPR